MERYTTLGRVCLKHENFALWTEIFIQCKDSKTGHFFTTATASYLGDVGSHEDDILTLLDANRKKVLFVAFSNIVKSSGSVICAFAMQAIEQTFKEGIKSFQWYEAAPMEEALCDSKVPIWFPDGFLGISLPSNSLMSDMDVITSLATTVQNNQTVVIPGTKNGEIKKLSWNFTPEVRFRYDLMIFRNLFYAIKFRDEQDNIERIYQNPVFDREEKNLFISSGSEVMKLPIGSCSFYLTCFSCLTRQDPLDCGWYSTYCAHTGEKLDTDDAVRSEDTCIPEIFSFSPKEGKCPSMVHQLHFRSTT